MSDKDFIVKVVDDSWSREAIKKQETSFPNTVWVVDIRRCETVVRRVNQDGLFEVTARPLPAILPHLDCPMLFYITKGIIARPLLRNELETWRSTVHIMMGGGSDLLPPFVAYRNGRVDFETTNEFYRKAAEPRLAEIGGR